MSNFWRDEPLVGGLEDTDFYKPTMAQMVWHRFPGTRVKYAFRCRTRGADLRPLIPAIRDHVNALAGAQFSGSALERLNQLRYIKKDFIEFLTLLRLDPRAVSLGERDGQLDIRVEGSWLLTIWWEIYLLSIVSELYYRRQFPEPDIPGAERLLMKKIGLVRAHRAKWGPDKKFRLMEFGTRRRFSRQWQRRVIEILKNEIPDELLGTSNLGFATEFNLRAIGTMAHEVFQAMQAQHVRLAESQKFALENWVQEYRGDLGIALTDIWGIDAFLADFDLYFAKLFDGLRHDSGDPFEWSRKVIAHYNKLRIDPSKRFAVYSDGNDFPRALAICEEFEGQLITSFGIGTNLTCDIPGITPLQSVVKMVECNGQPVAKLSDSPGKEMCEDEGFVAYLREVIRRKISTA